MAKKKNKEQFDAIAYFKANKILVAIGIIVVILFVIFFVSFQQKKCNDLDCFISNANECNSAIYLETTEFGTVKYSISADSDNCTLTKQIIELNDTEDPFLKKALQGKKMECTYTKGNFNGQWIISLIEGLEACQGNLKDAIASLLLVV